MKNFKIFFLIFPQKKIRKFWESAFVNNLI